MYEGKDPFVRAAFMRVKRILDDLKDRKPQKPYRPLFEYEHGGIPYKQVSTASNITVHATETNILWYVTCTAAINFDVPDLPLGGWIQVINDSGSTHNITVRDSSPATIATLTPGDNSGIIIYDPSAAPDRDWETSLIDIRLNKNFN